MSLAVSEKMVDHLTEAPSKVLVVEDDFSLREALEDTLTLANYAVVSAKSAEAAVELLAKQNDISMVVSDVNMGDMSGHELLQHVKKNYAHIPVLLITAYASIRDSVDAIRNGAIDYLVKPFEPKSLVDIVTRQLGGVISADKDLPIAEDEYSKNLFQLAQRVAQSDSTVLIVGESGTGKEVLARYVHQQSVRSTQPFVAINCAAIPENMLEAMLFGHEKGAYTGAYSSAPGKFEQANGGTLLLDEISEMDIGLQAKILRVLQEKEVERIGGRKTIELDVRVIATSNRDMVQQVSEGKFREDLYYRLSVLPLIWKPLRERPKDILPLAHQLLRKHAAKQKRNNIHLSECAQLSLAEHNWPGNVRELDNVIQRALILQAGSLIRAEDLGLHLLTSPQEKAPESFAASVSSLTTQEIIHQATNGFNGSQASSELAAISEATSSDTHQLPTHDESSKQLGDDLQQREFEIILMTLNEEKGSRKNTAKRLGISPRTLRYKLAKMRDLGLDITGKSASNLLSGSF